MFVIWSYRVRVWAGYIGSITQDSPSHMLTPGPDDSTPPRPEYSRIPHRSAATQVPEFCPSATHHPAVSRSVFRSVSPFPAMRFFGPIHKQLW